MPMARRIPIHRVCAESHGEIRASHSAGRIGHNLPQEAPKALAESVIDANLNVSARHRRLPKNSPNSFGKKYR